MANDNTQIKAWLEAVERVNPRAVDVCWWCGRPFDTFAHSRQVQHIERRNWVRREERDHPCNLMLVCLMCHQGALGASHAEIHAAQLARKLVYDPSHFSLLDWLRLRDPLLTAHERVTVADMAKHLEVKRETKSDAAEYERRATLQAENDRLWIACEVAARMTDAVGDVEPDLHELAYDIYVERIGRDDGDDPNDRDYAEAFVRSAIAFDPEAAGE